VPEAPYYQISPAGHCPHDEVPEVNHTMSCPSPLDLYHCGFLFGFSYNCGFIIITDILL
jgi:hypothetical protein